MRSTAEQGGLRRPGKMDKGSEGALWFQMGKSGDYCGDCGTKWRLNVGSTVQCREAHSRGLTSIVPVALGRRQEAQDQ